MRKTTIAIASVAFLAAAGTVTTAAEHRGHEGHEDRGDRRGSQEHAGRWRSAPAAPVDAEARASVRSLTNCAACHAGAADWAFDDDRVKIPAN
jgi:mono/diheme cytochrome c family protein